MSDLTEALGRLAEARDRLAEAKAEHLSARDSVHAALDRIASERTADGGIDGELARELYWQAPEVHVERIGNACGIVASRVYRHAGESVRLGFHCPRCDKDYSVHLRSRTAVAKVLTSKHPKTLCGPCDAESREESLAAWRAFCASRWPDDE